MVLLSNQFLIIYTLILFVKYLVYIRNLKYAHLTPIFGLQISIRYSIPTHTNINGYCEQKK